MERRRSCFNRHSKRLKLSDQLFGTRLHTQGAQYQLPRKVPLRIEPKTFFANERTFISWLKMAVTVGGVTSALVGYQFTNLPEQSEQPDTPISKDTSDLITLILLPLAIVLVIYASITYYWRSSAFHNKQVGYYNDRFGPIVLATLVLICLTAILIISYIDFFT